MKRVTLEGRVEREDLGPGVWLLVTPGGDRYLLAASDAGLLRAGHRVRVRGQVDEQAAGIGMTGDPTLAVESYETLS